MAVGATNAAVTPATEARLLTGMNQWRGLTTPPLVSGTFTDASCATAYCLFAGSAGSGNVLWRFTPSPATLTSVPVLAGLGIRSVGCAPGGCAYIDTAPSGATRFVSLTTPQRAYDLRLPAGQQVVGLGCVTTRDCTLATTGETAMLASTQNRGATWTNLAIPPSWTAIVALTCADGSCHYLVAQGGSLLLSRFQNNAWSQTAVPAGSRALACVSATTCVVVGGDPRTPTAAWVEGGQSIPIHLTYVPTGLTAVSCDPSACLASGPTTLVALPRAPSHS